MPSRMSNRRSKTCYKRFAIVSSIAIPVLLIVSLVFIYSGTAKNNMVQTRVSSVKKTHKMSSKNAEAVSNSSSEISSSTQKNDTSNLIGIGFQIMPILFNGEDVTKAMGENKAPQNTVHDGSQLGYFSNSTQARVSGVARYMYAHTINYGYDNGILNMKDWHIPVDVINGELQPVQWEAEDYAGNTITWKMEPLSNAESVVEAHKNPNEEANSSSDLEVDPRNLSTTQMEHWVRSYLEATVQDYNASEYTFTQKFVDGYAEVNEYKKNTSTGKFELAMIYRVDENGYLQVSSQYDGGSWHVVEKEYK